MAFVAVLAVAAAFIDAAGVAAQSDTTAIRARLQAKLDSLHAAGSFPGAVAGVALPDGRVISVAVGESDTSSHTRMRPSDLMLAGSTGKTFFGAVALQLVSEGRISLDDPISKHLGSEPWFARLPNAAEITIRMLMNHTSGLVRYEFDDAFTRDLKADPYRKWKPEEQVAFLLDTRAPFAAGQGWTYSDTNYIVLAMIMEQVLGEPMYDAIAKRVIEPLGLESIVPQTGPELPGLVQGYAGQGNPFADSDEVIVNGRFVFDPSFEWAGGGFMVNAGSLARWAKLLYENRAFDARVNADWLAGVEARGLGRGVRYGLGVIIADSPFGTTYGHSGFFPGYLTEMRYWPDHDFAIAIQVKRDNRNTACRRRGCEPRACSRPPSSERSRRRDNPVPQSPPARPPSGAP
jgi:D-alanyl-D-alanine carboxypeptidase